MLKVSNLENVNNYCYFVQLLGLLYTSTSLHVCLQVKLDALQLANHNSEHVAIHADSNDSKNILVPGNSSHKALRHTQKAGVGNP